LKDRLKLLMPASDRAGGLIRAHLQSLAYAAEMIPEIADTPKPIDDAMRWGFNREAGPFEMWDMLGVEDTVEAMKEAGFSVPIWVNEMLSHGIHTFYRTAGEIKTGVYSPIEKNYIPIQKSSAYLSLKDEKESGRLVSQNPGASLVDLRDGILCVEFQTKMNALDDDIFNMINEGMDLVEKGYEGLVIGNEGENFSVGANLMMVVMGAQSGLWDQLEAAVRKMQMMNMRMRYFPKPVIVAPAGMALGGGAEIMMYASRIVAHIELYAGLVEFGAGLIPAGGGTKEIIRRIINPPMVTPNAIVLPFLQRVRANRLCKSCYQYEETRQLGILGKEDRVVMNRDHLISDAKTSASFIVGGINAVA
jgi:3-hydroxyacyl-CoA dehydrogenase